MSDIPDQQSKEPNWFQKAQANQPSLWAEIKAMTREAVKDIRQTMNEVFFNQHEHAPEPGAPMNPTQIMTTDELRPDDFDHHTNQGYSRER